MKNIPIKPVQKHSPSANLLAINLYIEIVFHMPTTQVPPNCFFLWVPVQSKLEYENERKHVNEIENRKA
jgi:hypothetical protein